MCDGTQNEGRHEGNQQREGETVHRVLVGGEPDHSDR